MSSYRKINYSLRPAKSIERKMICEAISRLSIFDKIENYSYIGFGSTFYSDFSLFHRALGMKTMFSIEKDVHAKKRFEFNKPYECISPLYDHSNVALPQVPLNKLAVLWLDYDDPLKSEMLTDLNTFFSSAVSGSMFLMSVNAEGISLEKDQDTELTAQQIGNLRIEALKARISAVKVPPGTTAADVVKKNISKTYLKVIANEIQEVLANRNGGINDEALKYEYTQILNFKYSDGAEMLTCGGILYQNKDKNKFLQANFPDLEFVRTSDEHFKIEIPSLTLREIKLIESLLPNNVNLQNGNLKGIPSTLDPMLPGTDVLKFAKIYRYFPHFTEAIF